MEEFALRDLLCFFGNNDMVKLVSNDGAIFTGYIDSRKAEIVDYKKNIISFSLFNKHSVTVFEDGKIESDLKCFENYTLPEGFKKVVLGLNCFCMITEKGFYISSTSDTSKTIFVPTEHPVDVVPGPAGFIVNTACGIPMSTNSEWMECSFAKKRSSDNYEIILPFVLTGQRIIAMFPSDDRIITILDNGCIQLYAKSENETFELIQEEYNINITVRPLSISATRSLIAFDCINEYYYTTYNKLMLDNVTTIRDSNYFCNCFRECNMYVGVPTDIPYAFARENFESDRYIVVVDSELHPVKVNPSGAEHLGFICGDQICLANSETTDFSCIVLGTRFGEESEVCLYKDRCAYFVNMQATSALTDWRLLHRTRGLLQDIKIENKTIQVDYSVDALLKFPFEHGQEVEHKKYGKGIVAGERCKYIWVVFKDRPRCFTAKQAMRSFKDVKAKEFDDKNYIISKDSFELGITDETEVYKLSHTQGNFYSTTKNGEFEVVEIEIPHIIYSSSDVCFIEKKVAMKPKQYKINVGSSASYKNKRGELIRPSDLVLLKDNEYAIYVGSRTVDGNEYYFEREKSIIIDIGAEQLSEEDAQNAKLVATFSPNVYERCYDVDDNAYVDILVSADKPELAFYPGDLLNDGEIVAGKRRDRAEIYVLAGSNKARPEGVEEETRLVKKIKNEEKSLSYGRVMHKRIQRIDDSRFLVNEECCFSDDEDEDSSSEKTIVYVDLLHMRGMGYLPGQKIDDFIVIGASEARQIIIRSAETGKYSFIDA